MSRKFLGLLSVTLLFSLLLLGQGQIFAATTGSGPDTALPINGTTTNLAMGQEIWYAFQYAGDKSQITVDMNVNPSGGATYSIWTPADVQSWANGNGENPVGRGAVDNYVDNGDLVWSGNFDIPGTYYVVVDQAGLTPSSFTLKISGSGVALPAMTQQPAAAATTEMVSTSTSKSTVMGMGPNTALAAKSGWTTLAVGKEVWYAFQYAGDGSQILIDMQTSPSNSIAFSVMTPADVQSWAAGNGFNPVGRGSADNYLNNGDLVWSGNFNQAGTYYVVVDQIGPTPGAYSFQVTGTGVSLATGQ